MAKDKIQNFKQYVSFFISDELFGIDIKLINEVNPNVNIVPIPLSSSYIRGYVNIRGQVVLVIDLAVLFGRQRSALSFKSHIILFKTRHDFLRLQNADVDIDFNIFGDKSIAILVDAIGDVISIQPDQVETPTEHINNVYSEFVDGIAKTREELLVILNPVKILTYRREPAAV